MEDDRQSREDESEWGSIFGLPIPLRRLRWHFWVFGASVTAMTALNIAARLAPASALRWYQIPPAITADIIPTVIFCGVFSPISVEATAMVIAAYYQREQRRKQREERQKLLEEHKKEREKAQTEGREEGREEGRAEGRAESNAAWREWLDRMQAAQAAGEPFDEPPPDANDA